MENRKRTIQIKFRVTEGEKKLIEQKMAQLPTKHIGAYMRKMAIDGYIIYTDLSEFKEFQKELQSIGRNVNQIAKRIISTSTAYDADIIEIKERLNEIWKLQRRMLLSFRKLS